MASNGHADTAPSTGTQNFRAHASAFSDRPHVRGLNCHWRRPFPLVARLSPGQYVQNPMVTNDTGGTRPWFTRKANLQGFLNQIAQEPQQPHGYGLLAMAVSGMGDKGTATMEHDKPSFPG
jgi:hypothetical protein